ncbi:hypothetical protein ACFL1R_08025 [Candidatus Latescibacterota bacterium]
MKPQYHHNSCPNCGHREPLFKIRIPWSRWPCPSYGSLLRGGGRRNLLVELLGLVWLVVFFGRFVEPNLPFWVSSIVFLMGIALFGMLEGVRLAEQPPDGLRTHRSDEFASTNREEILRSQGRGLL